MSTNYNLHRVHGMTRQEVESLLRGLLDGFEIETHPDFCTLTPTEETSKSFESQGMKLDEGRLGFWSESPDTVTFDVRLYEIHDLIIEELCARGATFVHHEYHDGAGVDECAIYVRGERRYGESLGLYDPQRIDFDGDERDLDSEGFHGDDVHWPMPFRQNALDSLARDLGEARVILNGWERAIENQGGLGYALFQ